LADEIEAEEALFGSVLSVLRALASSDDRISEYFRTISEGKRWKGGHIPFEIKLPHGLTFDAERFIRAI
jgi:hypothetical protein